MSAIVKTRLECLKCAHLDSLRRLYEAFNSFKYLKVFAPTTCMLYFRKSFHYSLNDEPVSNLSTYLKVKNENILSRILT